MSRMGGVLVMTAVLVVLANATAPAAQRPFITPTWGVLSSPAGWRVHPIRGDWRVHWGIDIAAPMGTQVVASRAGVVASAGTAPGYGRFIVIAHDQEWVTVYGHLSVTVVTPGIVVAQGQGIGRVGDTGLVTGPHLHFEVRYRGRPVDPLAALGVSR